jgi:hypothetical protein
MTTRPRLVPIRLRGLVLSYAQGQLYVLPFTYCTTGRHFMHEM